MISNQPFQSLYPKKQNLDPDPYRNTWLDAFCEQVDNIRVQAVSFIRKILESIFFIIMAHY